MPSALAAAAATSAEAPELKHGLDGLVPWILGAVAAAGFGLAMRWFLSKRLT